MRSYHHYLKQLEIIEHIEISSSVLKCLCSILISIICFHFLVKPSYSDGAINLQTLPTYFTGDSDRTNSIAWGDFDADGDLDLAVGNGLVTDPIGELCLTTHHNKIYKNDNGIIQPVPIWISPDSDKAVTTSLAWGDIDNDGDLDLAVGNCNTSNRIYINDGLDEQGKLQMHSLLWNDRTQEYTSSVAWGDMNGDGFLDLAVGNANAPSKVYLNQQDGTLQSNAIWSTAVTVTTRSVAWGDMDRDGDLDLALGNYGSPNEVYLNQNNKLQTTPIVWPVPSEPTYSVAWGDIDKDGYLDLAVGNARAPSKVYLNDTQGMLRFVPAWIETVDIVDIDKPTISITWGDLNLDGDFELVVGGPVVKVYDIHCTVENQCITNSVWKADLATSTRSVALGDVDQDGDLDLAVGATSYSANRLHLNSGIPLQAFWKSEKADEDNDSVEDITTSVVWGDIDNDSDLDLLAGYASPDGHIRTGGTKVYYNVNGKISISGRKLYLDTDDVRNIALGDIDRNDYLDLVVGSSKRFCTSHEPAKRQLVKLYFNYGGRFDSVGIPVGEPSCITSLALGDINEDGHLDIAVGNGENNLAEQNKLYLNDGKGKFTEDIGRLPALNRTFGVAWGDIDRDGDLDLAVANENELNEVYLNQGGTLQKDPGWVSNDTGICGNPAWGDVNNDSYLDLAVRCWTGPNKLYLNNKKGGLPQVPSWLSEDGGRGLGITFGDVDGDGDLDLALAQGDAEKPVLIYLNQNGELQTKGILPHLYDRTGAGSVAWGDIEGDGDLDLAVGGVINQIFINRGQESKLEPMGYLPYIAINRPIATGNANFYSSPIVITSQFITIPYSLFDTDGDALGKIAAFYSLDGGGYWQPALATRDSMTSNLKTVSAALAFDGVDDYVQLPAMNYDYAQGFTVEAWVNFDRFNNWSRIIDLGNGRESDNILFANTGISQDLSFEVYVGGTSHGMRVSNVLESKSWHHLAATIDAFGNAVLYKDGAIIQQGILPLPRSIPRASNFIGRSNWLPQDGHFAGQIDEVRIWNVARTQAQIQAKMAERLSKDEDKVGLVADWHFNEGAGSIAIDHTPNKNDGLLGGGIADQQPQRRNRPTTHYFVWDTFASGLFGKSNNVVFRLEAYPQLPTTGIAGSYRYPNAVPGPFQFVYASATTYPFSVRGTQIQVVDDTGNPLADAQVYRIPAGQVSGGTLISNGTSAFRTNSQGYLQGRGALGLGDQLLALAPQPLPPTITARDSDTVHLYYTNGYLTPDGQVRAWISNTQSVTVTQPGVQVLQVSQQHPLLLFDVDVTLEWDASQEPRYVDQLQADLKESSRYLYDFTNGQVALGRIRVAQDADEWANAHIVVHATNRLRPYATIFGAIITDTVDFSPTLPITYAAGQIHIGAVWNRYGDINPNPGIDWPLILAHELSHYLLGLEDTYLGLATPPAVGAEVLINVEGCRSAMGDLYNPDYTEFIFDDTLWHAACAQTLANQELARDEWRTLTGWFPWLVEPTEVIAGPNVQPFDFTTVTVLPPITPTQVLPNQAFYLDYTGNVSSTSEARVFVLRDDNGDGVRDYIYDLGNAFGDQKLLRAHGVQPGDQLCVFDRPRHQASCEHVHAGDDRLQLAEQQDWQPVVQVSLVNSTTFDIQVINNASSTDFGLQARVFPEYGTETNTVPLTLVGNTYRGTLTIREPALAGHLALTSSVSNRAAIVAYSIGGNPGNWRSSGGGFSRGGGNWRSSGGGFSRGSGNWRSSGGGDVRTGDAPSVSPDGKLIFFATEDIKLAEGQFYTVQDMAGLPALPVGKTAIGQGYNLAATGFPTGSNPLPGSVSIQYVGLDILTEKADESQLGLHFWDGQQWRTLATHRDPKYNLAAARSQGPGIYALLAGVTTPQITAVSPALANNSQDQSITIAGNGFLAPLSVLLVAPNATYTLPVQSMTSTQITALVAATVLPAEYEVIVVNHHQPGGDARSPVAGRFSLFTASPACFDDRFDSGTAQWVRDGAWDITSPTNGEYAMTDSPTGPYRDASDYGADQPIYTTSITSMPFSLAGCSGVPQLFFAHDYTFARSPAGDDRAIVEISTNAGISWTQLISFTGGGIFDNNSLASADASFEWQDVVWQPITLSLQSYVNAQSLQLRFSLQVNNDHVTSRGWIIKEVQVRAGVPTGVGETPEPINQLFVPFVAR